MSVTAIFACKACKRTFAGLGNSPDTDDDGKCPDCGFEGHKREHTNAPDTRSDWYEAVAL